MPKQALTNEDLKLLRETFATKDEVRNIVKEELRKEIGNLPTKEEFYKRMDKLSGEYQKFSIDSENILGLSI